MNKITQPTIVTVADIIDEGKDFKTFVFDYELSAKPGQYVMLWLPGVDLKPFSVALQTKKQFGLTVIKVGPFTTELFKVKKGAKLGFNGPYGTNYDINDKKNILIIGGGSGVASVTFLAQVAREKKIGVDFVLTAKTEDKIIYEDWLKKIGVNVYHRFQDKKYERAWDVIADLIEKNRYDGIYACGPELLLERIVDLSLEKKIPCQVSLERYMKCGIGICGQCCIDPLGVCLCEVGPVVDSQFAQKITEFGKYHRDTTGQKIDF